MSTWLATALAKGVTMTATEIIAERDPGAALGNLRSRTGLTWAGPATYLAPERQRLAGLRWEHFTAEQLGATVGAELSGIDLTGPLSDAMIAEIRQALHDYKVIFFRDQPLTPDQHIAFARRFGDLEIHPFIPANAAHPELVRFEKSAEVSGYENSWHHDVTWREVPSMGAVLHAIHVPVAGGDTSFSDMYAAYDALDDEMKSLIDGRLAEHDFMRAFGRQVPDERKAEMRATYPLVQHPVAITHPETGKKLLYVNRNFTNRIVGLSDTDSAAVLEELFAHATIIEHQARFRWRQDSVAFWDNRAVQHYASSDYWPEVRIMERASIIGTRPAA
jgi:alpha-ketoglutarate-dependent taurine dioxygenase